MQFQLRKRLEDFGFENLPKPEKHLMSRPASLMERLKTFYYALRSPVICPNDNSQVKPTGRIIIESRITDPRHGSYTGFKSAEGECRNCHNRYSVAGMSCISSASREDLEHKESLLYYIDAALGLMPSGGIAHSL